MLVAMVVRRELKGEARWDTRLGKTRDAGHLGRDHERRETYRDMRDTMEMRQQTRKDRKTKDDRRDRATRLRGARLARRDTVDEGETRRTKLGSARNVGTFTADELWEVKLGLMTEKKENLDK